MSTPRLLDGTRNQRYGEVLLAYLDAPIRLEVYNSYMLNDCPQELWSLLSAEAIAKQFNASFAVLNGPRYWLMDGIGKVELIEPVLCDFGGISMRRAATIEFTGALERAPYRQVTVNRGAAWHFDAGKPVHELVTSDGDVYVMQAYCTGIDPTISPETLGDFGSKLALPNGWVYRTRILDEELTIDTTTHAATVLQDEFENTYSLVA